MNERCPLRIVIQEIEEIINSVWEVYQTSTGKQFPDTLCHQFWSTVMKITMKNRKEVKFITEVGLQVFDLFRSNEIQLHRKIILACGKIKGFNTS